MNMRNKYFLAVIALMMTAMPVRSQLANTSKMSPMLADKLTENVAAARTVGQAPATEEYVLALVKLASEQENNTLQEHGCVVFDRVGSISIALLPVSQLGLLSMDDHVVRMEANPLSRPLLDVTPGAVNVLPAYRGEQLPQAYTGRGVVVGVADIGFDYTHPMFRDANGQTRIRQAWDIYTWGTQGYVGVGELLNTPEQLAAARGSSDSTQFHGTHVAAIAAGSSFGTGRYQGIAYEADIVLSQVYLSSRTKEQQNLLLAMLNATLRADTADSLVVNVRDKKITLSSAMEALAVKHVMDYAAAHDQPCVVNCSFGSQERLTENYAVEEEMMNSLTGPGRIIVCSAGNDSDGIVYRVKPAGERMSERLWLKSSLTPSMTLRSAGRFTLRIVPDIDGADTLTVSSEAIRSAGAGGLKDSAYINGEKMQNEWFRIRSTAYENVFPGLTSYNIALTLPTPTSAYRSPSVAIEMEGDETEVMGAYRALTFNRLSQGEYVKNAPYNVCRPGLYAETVCVGATSHRDSVVNCRGERLTFDYNGNDLGQVLSWSGTGPTLDGRMKPDVVAPGHNIVSAFNSQMVRDRITQKQMNLITDSLHVDGKVYCWKAESGTSMAAPVVTGIVALWLQMNPRLTPDDVKQVLAKTARHPEPDETYPNYRYGYGEIDAYRGLLYLANLSGIKGLSEHQPRQACFRIEGRRLTVTGCTQAAVTVYALGGEVVLRTTLSDGTVNLSSLRPGVYAVQIDTHEAQTTGSTLVRIE